MSIFVFVSIGARPKVIPINGMNQVVFKIDLSSFADELIFLHSIKVSIGMLFRLWLFSKSSLKWIYLMNNCFSFALIKQESGFIIFCMAYDKNHLIIKTASSVTIVEIKKTYFWFVCDAPDPNNCINDRIIFGALIIM